jgi:MscS family membrane protein
VPKDQQDTEGPQLARHLKIALDQTLWVDAETLSRDPAGHLDDGLPPVRDQIGRIETAQGPVDILVQRVPREDGPRIWKISTATVAQIPALYEEFGYGRLGEWIPPIFFEIQFFELQLWQWIGLLALVFLAYLFGWGIAAAITKFAGALVRRTRTDVDDRVVALMVGPLRLIVAVIAFSAGKLTLGLTVPARDLLRGMENTLLIVAVAWIIMRFLDLVEEAVKDRLIRRGQVSATSLLPPGRRTAKVIVIGIAAIAMLSNFGFNVTALVAGLGVGGIAIALAAQKSLENLFGGITLYADQPVRVGDFCRFGDKIGTVEDIGLRSTRVRTLDRTVVSIPNAEFSNLQLENFAKRDRVRYCPRIGLRYETTPEQIRYILVEIRKVLYAHPKVNPDPARIRFVGFGAYSLDLDIFAYVDVTDYSEFLEVAEDLNLRIMDIVEQAG